MRRGKPLSELEICLSSCSSGGHGDGPVVPCKGPSLHDWTTTFYVTSNIEF